MDTKENQMCGRYVIKTSTPELARLLDADGTLLNTPERYNVAPTQDVPACRLNEEGARVMTQLRWGLVPSWLKDPKKGGYTMINARAESIHEKPAFRAPFKSRRCLIPADGYYEWRSEEKIKQPYYFRARAGAPMVFAGLWQRWHGGDEQIIESCSIVTTDANEDVSDIHHRMPVLLDDDDAAAWLQADADAATLKDLLRPAPAATLTHMAVSTYVNSVRNDGPACIEVRPLA